MNSVTASLAPPPRGGFSWRKTGEAHLVFLQALVLLALAMGGMTLAFFFTGDYVDETVLEIKAAPATHGLPFTWARPAHLPGVDYLHCRLAEPAASTGKLRVACNLVETGEPGINWLSVFPIRAGWQLGDSTTNTSRVPTAEDIPWLLLPSVLVVLLLARGQRWGADWQALTRLRWHLLWAVPAPFALVAALSVPARWLAWSLGWVDIDAAAQFEPPEFLASRLFPVMLALALWAPLWEELLFRGWLYRRLQPLMPAWLIALTISELFTLIHLGNLSLTPWETNTAAATFYLAKIFTYSLVLVWLRWRYGSVLLCMLAHLANNVAVFLLLPWLLS